MPARAGLFRHKLTIETPTEIVDSYGQAVKSWSTYSTPFGSVEPLQGREYFASNQFDSEVTVRIRLRHDPGITTRMRVSFDSRLYNIQSIITPAERGREMQLMCSEGLNDG